MVWIVHVQDVVGGPLLAGRALISFVNKSRAAAETCPLIQLKITPAQVDSDLVGGLGMLDIEGAVVLLPEQCQTPENALEVGHRRNKVFLDRRMG